MAQNAAKYTTHSVYTVRMTRELSHSVVRYALCIRKYQAQCQPNLDSVTSARCTQSSISPLNVVVLRSEKLQFVSIMLDTYILNQKFDSIRVQYYTILKKYLKKSAALTKSYKKIGKEKKCPINNQETYPPLVSINLLIVNSCKFFSIVFVCLWNRFFKILKILKFWK